MVVIMGHASVFLSASYFHSSLIFAGKAWSLPLDWAKNISRSCLTWLEVVNSYKRTSLQWLKIIGRESAVNRALDGSTYPS
jgi:hypothetical protein